MALTEKPLAVFVPDGAKAYAAAIADARLQIRDDHSFTISGGSLPPIVGRWAAYRVPATFTLGLWAKTDQSTSPGRCSPWRGTSWASTTSSRSTLPGRTAG